MEDDLIPNKINTMGLQSKDILIFVFGEIDIRCYVKLTLEHRKNLTLKSLLQDWVNNYINRIATLGINNDQIGIMSIVPPSTFNSAQSIDWPVSGSDEERALYTKMINKLLAEECKKRSWIYLDVYSKYADENGMLPMKKIYKSVHIANTSEVYKLLLEMKLLKCSYCKYLRIGICFFLGLAKRIGIL